MHNDNNNQLTSKDGRLPRPILTVDEVHIAAQLDRQFAMAHEVFHVDLVDYATLGLECGLMQVR